MELENLKQKTTPIFRRFGIKKAAVFGSVARGEARSDSDVDLLVEVKRPFGLVQFVSMKRGLETALSKSVDVVEYGSIKPAYEENILKDATVIYEQR